MTDRQTKMPKWSSKPIQGRVEFDAFSGGYKLVVERGYQGERHHIPLPQNLVEPMRKVFRSED